MVREQFQREQETLDEPAGEDARRRYFFFTGPYVMKDFDHFTRVWNGKLGQAARTEMEKNGNLKFLGTIYRGQRWTTNRISSPSRSSVYWPPSRSKK